MIELRRAVADDTAWLTALYADGDVEPFLGTQRAQGDVAILTEIESSQRESGRFGRMIVSLDGERAGAIGYHEVDERSRIVGLDALAIHPDFRRRGVADQAVQLLQRYLIVELGFHRLELACYGFNDTAIRHAERVGFVREGVKRKAHLRHGEWQDAVLFALLAEDFEEAEGSC